MPLIPWSLILFWLYFTACQVTEYYNFSFSSIWAAALEPNRSMSSAFLLEGPWNWMTWNSVLVYCAVIDKLRQILEKNVKSYFSHLLKEDGNAYLFFTKLLGILNEY